MLKCTAAAFVIQKILSNWLDRQFPLAFEARFMRQIILVSSFSHWRSTSWSCSEEFNTYAYHSGIRKVVFFKNVAQNSLLRNCWLESAIWGFWPNGCWPRKWPKNGKCKRLQTVNLQASFHDIDSSTHNARKHKGLCSVASHATARGLTAKKG